MTVHNWSHEDLGDGKKTQPVANGNSPPRAFRPRVAKRGERDQGDVRGVGGEGDAAINHYEGGEGGAAINPPLGLRALQGYSPPSAFVPPRAFLPDTRPNP